MSNRPHNGNIEERGSGARTPLNGMPLGGRKAINEGARAPRQPRPSKPPKR